METADQRMNDVSIHFRGTHLQNRYAQVPAVPSPLSLSCLTSQLTICQESVSLAYLADKAAYTKHLTSYSFSLPLSRLRIVFFKSLFGITRPSEVFRRSVLRTESQIPLSQPFIFRSRSCRCPHQAILLSFPGAWRGDICHWLLRTTSRLVTCLKHRDYTCTENLNYIRLSSSPSTGFWDQNSF